MRMDTEQISSEFLNLDALESGRILSALIDGNRRAVDAVAAAQPQLERAAEVLIERLGAGGRLVYVGAGTSGRLAVQDAAELLPTFSFDRTVVLMAGGAEAGSRALEGAEDDDGAAINEVEAAGISAADVVIGVAASGRTPYTVAGITRARQLGAATIGIANNPDTPLLSAAEVPVLLATGPEVLAGSTRLAAGTAQKIALNSLSTAALVKLGGAWRNLMVGMQPTNEKLRHRAVEIVASGADVSLAVAGPALEEAGWEMRTAIVMLLAAVEPETARPALEESGMSVRGALRRLGSSAG